MGIGVFRRACAVFMCAVLMAVSLVMPASGATKTLKVGWFAQDGYQELTADGKAYGFNYEYLMNISLYTGWKYEFVEMESFSECYEMLRSGKVDIMGYLLKTPEREKEVEFPEIQCGYVATSLYVKEESPIAPYDFEALDGIRVGCMPSKNPDYLMEYAKSNGFNVELVYYDNKFEVAQAVDSGKVAAGLLAGYQSEDHTRIVASFSPKPFYFAVAPGRLDLLEPLDNAMGMIQVEHPMMDKDLAHKYLPEVRNTLHLTQAERRYISQLDEVTVSYIDNWFPLTITDSKTGRFRGIVADVFERISMLTGIKFKYAKENGNDEGVNILATTMYVPSAYESGYRLTNSYLNVPLVMIKSNYDKESDVPQKTAMLHQLYQQVASNPVTDTVVVCYDTPEECMQAIMNGEVDQAIINAYASDYLLKRSEYNSLSAVVLYNESYNVCVGVPESEDVLLFSVISKALGIISASDMSAIINRNTSDVIDVNLKTIMDYMPMDILVISAAVLIVVVILLGVILAKQQGYSKRIRGLLYNDELTGILSQRGFQTMMPQRIQKASGKTPFVIDLDISNFRDYNAVNGYQSGNELLKLMADVLKRSLFPHEMAARIQADHFMLLYFDGNAEDNGLNSIKERLKALLVEFRRRASSNSLLLSFGIYSDSEDSEDVAAMCDRALIAKRSVKGNYDRYIGVYDGELHKKQLSNMDILADFEHAILNDEFVHWFQPKYDINDKSINGAEALVRWITPNGDVIPPGRFIELFEENGLICRLDMHMFNRLCKKIAAMLRDDIEPPPISINFSQAHLFDSDFAQKLKSVLDFHKLPPKYIQIEITETAFAENRGATIDTVNLLHEIGFNVAMDDFGSGYSSLNMLKDIQFDVIKLDRGFLGTVSQSARGEKVVRNIVTLAHDLKLQTVAEGVETEAQYQMLKRCSCDIVQGYYFSRPLPEAEFDKLIK